MIRFILKRTLWALLTIFLFATVMFFLVQIIIPGDFTVQFAMSQTKSQREAMREELGLNLPLWQQYLNWIRNFFTGSFGESFYGYSVFDMFKSTIPLSLLVFFTGTALAFIIGLWLGKYTGWRGTGAISSITTLGGITLYTTFPPWLAWLIMYFIGSRFNIHRPVFRSNSFAGLDRNIWGATPLTPAMVAWRMLITIIAVIPGVFLSSSNSREHGHPFCRKTRVIVDLENCGNLTIPHNFTWNRGCFRIQGIQTGFKILQTFSS